jgi:hypothetical protein
VLVEHCNKLVLRSKVFLDGWHSDCCITELASGDVYDIPNIAAFKLVDTLNALLWVIFACSLVSLVRINRVQTAVLSKLPGQTKKY